MHTHVPGYEKIRQDFHLNSILYLLQSAAATAATLALPAGVTPVQQLITNSGKHSVAFRGRFVFAIEVDNPGVKVGHSSGVLRSQCAIITVLVINRLTGSHWPIWCVCVSTG